MVSNGHIWSRMATHGSEKPECFTMHGEMFQHARLSFRMGDKRFDNGYLSGRIFRFAMDTRGKGLETNPINTNQQVHSRQFQYPGLYRENG